MFSYEASSTSIEALHHDGEELPLSHTLAQLSELASEVGSELQSLAVDANHTIDSIAEYFGIHHFGHHITVRSLAGCELTLHPHGILEIRRPGALHPTSFPVVRRQSVLAA
jgi:hypothetical protein